MVRVIVVVVLVRISALGAVDGFGGEIIARINGASKAFDQALHHHHHQKKKKVSRPETHQRIDHPFRSGSTSMGVQVAQSKSSNVDEQVDDSTIRKRFDPFGMVDCSSSSLISIAIAAILAYARSFSLQSFVLFVCLPLLLTPPAVLDYFGCLSKSTAKALPFILCGSALCLSPSQALPRSDIAFAIAFPLYLACMNRFRFQRNILGKEKEQVPLLRDGRGPWFQIYLSFFGIIGLVLPLILLLVPGDAGNAAVPHFFLVLSQVGMETVTQQNPNFHTLPRLLTPIGFNAFRLRTLWIWIRMAGATYNRTTTGTPIMQYWAGFAWCLAVVNLVAWIYNLFIFLLLRCVPQYLNLDEFPVPEVTWKGQLIPLADHDDKKGV